MELQKLKYLTKSSAYEILLNIKNSGDDTANKYLAMMVGSQKVPYDVVAYINRYKSLPQLETYNRIYERRRKNPLYHNLVNESSSDIDKALALSSLITQSLIRMKELDDNDKKVYADIMNIPIISSAITKYTMYGDSSDLNDVFMMVREIFKRLFSKD